MNPGDKFTTFGPDGGTNEVVTLVSGLDSNRLCRVLFECDGKIRIRSTKHLMRTK